MDEEQTHWWSTDLIKNIPDEYHHAITHPDIAGDASSYLFFADHLVWSAAWAIACGNDKHRGHIAFINGTNDKFVASSFANFVDRYVEDFGNISY